MKSIYGLSPSILNLYLYMDESRKYRPDYRMGMYICWHNGRVIAVDTEPKGTIYIGPSMVLGER